MLSLGDDKFSISLKGVIFDFGTIVMKELVLISFHKYKSLKAHDYKELIFWKTI